MHNAPVKQHEIIGYVDRILKGIHEVDEKEVINGLEILHNNIDFNTATPLSPFFDLVTGISHGREDFLSLECMHLLALVIRDMAQVVYQWAQESNKGVAHVTKDELTTSLADLIKLLESTKEPCISSITNLSCAKAIASCLAMPTSDTNEWWDRLIFVGELIGDALQLTAGITTGRADTSFKAGLSILQRLYKSGASMYKMLKATNEQALVMQIAVVNAWKEIIQTGSNTQEPPKEQVEKILESLKQYFEEGVLGQEDKLQKATRMLKKAKDAITNLVQAAPHYRKCLINVLYKEIEALEGKLDNQDADQGNKIIEPLRNLAFHALVDLYVETASGSVRCEILKVFGELARCLCEQDSWSDKEWRDEQLSSLIGKKEKIDTIEQAAFRILVEAVWPTVLEQKDQDKPVALSLTSRNAVELSKEWEIRCMAIEELLRFEDHYLKSKGDEDNKEAKAPISSFLDEMGREYQVTALLLNKFSFKDYQVHQLRKFLHSAKKIDKARKLLRGVFDLEEADIDKLLTKKNKDTVKEFLASNSKLEEGEREAVLRKEAMAMTTLKVRLKQKLNIELPDSDIDLISDFLRGEISQKELQKKEESIKAWLGKRLKLQDEECDTLIQFLQQGKDQQEQPQQEKYSQHPVRPVLDILIDQFKLTQAERNLIDETIFKGQRGHTAQELMIEKVGEALKSFFGQDNNIACAFNNLDRIKDMIQAEKRLG